MQLDSIGNVLVLQLELFESNQGISRKLANTSNVKGVSSDCYTIGGQKYQASCAIFHHGELMEQGHYTSWIKKKNGWIQINDANISKQKWSRNSKDMYIIILEKIKN